MKLLKIKFVKREVKAQPIREKPRAYQEQIQEMKARFPISRLC